MPTENPIKGLVPISKINIWPIEAITNQSIKFLTLIDPKCVKNLKLSFKDTPTDVLIDLYKIVGTYENLESLSIDSEWDKTK